MKSKQYYTELADDIQQAQGELSSLLKNSDMLIKDDIETAHNSLSDALRKVLLQIGSIEYYGLENEDNK